MPHDLQPRQRQMRGTWSLGDYQRIAERQLPIAVELCEWTGVTNGQQMVDLGTATGNVAITAARRGAEVSALDITPRMLEIADTRAHGEGLVIELVEGDIEDLPFADGSFDVALSACGLWFAPRPDVAVGEARRVLRDGGRLGLANFTPDGYMGRINELITGRLPLPDDRPEPNQWGREDVARAQLSGAFRDIECRHAAVRYTFASARRATDFFAAYSPPHVAAGRALGSEGAAELFEEIEDYTAAQFATHDGIRIDAEYLLVQAHAS